MHKPKKSSIGKELQKNIKRMEEIAAKIHNFEIQHKKNACGLKELKQLKQLGRLFRTYQKDIVSKLEKINSKLKQKSQ